MKETCLIVLIMILSHMGLGQRVHSLNWDKNLEVTFPADLSQHKLLVLPIVLGVSETELSPDQIQEQENRIRLILSEHYPLDNLIWKETEFDQNSRYQMKMEVGTHYIQRCPQEDWELDTEPCDEYLTTYVNVWIVDTQTNITYKKLSDRLLPKFLKQYALYLNGPQTNKVLSFGAVVNTPTPLFWGQYQWALRRTKMAFYLESTAGNRMFQNNISQMESIEETSLLEWSAKLGVKRHFNLRSYVLNQGVFGEVNTFYASMPYRTIDGSIQSNNVLGVGLGLGFSFRLFKRLNFSYATRMLIPAWESSTNASFSPFRVESSIGLGWRF